VADESRGAAIVGGWSVADESRGVAIVGGFGEWRMKVGRILREIR